MTQLDPRISLSDSLRAELLLELSGLSRDQQLMIKACAAGSHDFDTYDAVYTKDGWVGAVHSYKLCTSNLVSKPLWLTEVQVRNFDPSHGWSPPGFTSV